MYLCSYVKKIIGKLVIKYNISKHNCIIQLKKKLKK